MNKQEIIERIDDLLYDKASISKEADEEIQGLIDDLQDQLVTEEFCRRLYDAIKPMNFTSMKTTQNVQDFIDSIYKWNGAELEKTLGIDATMPPPPPPMGVGGSPAGGRPVVNDSYANDFIEEYNAEFQITPDTSGISIEDKKIAQKAIEHVHGFLEYDQRGGLSNRRINFLKEPDQLLYNFDDKKAEYVGYAFRNMLSTASMTEEDMLEHVQPMLRNFYLEQEQYIASHGLEPQDVDFKSFYNNLETVLNIAHPKINLVDFLVDIGHQKSELKCFNRLLHNAVLDTTCPVGEHYLNGDNIGKVIDFYCSAEKSEVPFKNFLTHKNFKSLVQNPSSQRAVFQALNSSIKNEKLTKLLGDECRDIIKKATDGLPPKDQNKLLSQIDKSQSRLPEATAIDAWGTQPDESRQNGRVSKEDDFKPAPVKAVSVSDEKAPTSQTTKNWGLGTVAATIVGVIVCVALAAAAPAAMGIAIASTVGVFCAGSTFTYNSYKDDQLVHKNAELENAKDQLHSAYQDRGQHPADLRKGPPYAERAENGRGSDRSNERGGRF